MQIGDVGKLRQMLRLGLHRPVRRHKGGIEEERLALVPLDEGCRLASEGIGGVFFLPHQFGTAIQIADEAGLDRAAAETYLAGSGGIAEVQAELERAVDIGVSGVPCFLLGGTFQIPGAQNAEVMASFITRAKTKLAAVV